MVWTIRPATAGGVLMIDPREEETPGEGGQVSGPEDKAVYTNYQKALSKQG